MGSAALSAVDHPWTGVGQDCWEPWLGCVASAPGSCLCPVDGAPSSPMPNFAPLIRGLKAAPVLATDPHEMESARQKQP